jgi:4-diphosphocytidyl-2-C-methyl-D-erythritol kinase
MMVVASRNAVPVVPATPLALKNGCTQNGRVSSCARRTHRQIHVSISRACSYRLAFNARQATTVAASGGPATIKAFSPAKINVFLRVVRRREDGFHDLASLFHVIDLGDDMDIELLPPSATEDELSCNWADVPLDASNLVIKAADLFRTKTGRKDYFRVHLEKRVPHGAGMGGGSGNAATMLWAANVLTGEPASNQDLLDWSGDIGSDISVFFSDGAAYCTGRGEIVENVDPPIPLDTPMLLVKPPVGLSTPQIFKALDLDRRSTTDAKDILDNLCSGKWKDASNYVNDLEQPAFDCLPELKALKDRLRSEGNFDAVFMTGSGSTIVGIGSDVAPAFLSEPAYDDLFVASARLMTRSGPGSWYAKN